MVKRKDKGKEKDLDICEIEYESALEELEKYSDIGPEFYATEIDR